MLQDPPKNITAKKTTRKVIVTWQDGHESVYPFHLLRAGCPCAVCRGGHENMKPDPDEAVFDVQLPDSPATQLVNVEAVGNYGVTFVWGDGHREGIYSWHYLRALCPCQSCRSKHRENSSR